MVSPSLTPPSRGLQILKIGLYILAGLVLLIGLILSISLMVSANSTVANLLLPLQLLGGGAFYNLLAPMLSGFLINLGVVILIFTIILSALLYAIALLISRTLHLESRLAYLEARFRNS